MKLTDTQRAWLEANGITVKGDASGTRFFKADRFGYARGSVVSAIRQTGGRLWVRLLGKSRWEKHLACHMAPQPVEYSSLRAALAALAAE